MAPYGTRFPVLIDTDNGIPLYVQLEEQIRLLVHRGVLESGDLIPTVRELAVQLGINSNTVARVYRDLQRDGLLVLKRGVGTFVSQRTQVHALGARDIRALEERADHLIALSHQMNLKPAEVFQLIETRWKENSDADRK